MIEEYLLFFVTVVCSVIFAKIFHFVLVKYVSKITEKTKTNIDDILLNLVTKPLYILILLIGVYIGLKSVSELQIYSLYIDSGFFVASVLIISQIFSRILSVLTSNWLKVEKKYKKTPQLITKIVKILIYLIAILIILDHFNIEITPLVATLGVGGLAVGLALQSTLSDFFAGLHILSDKPVKVGDYIELENKLSGFVEDIGWRSTRIRTLPNNIVVIPNSKLAESIITNYSAPQQETGIVIQCGVGYGSDLKKVEKVTVDVAKKIQKKIKGAVSDFEPFIRFHTFGDSNIEFSVILRVEKPVDKYLVTHEFIKALKERYDKEGIEISWPVRKIYYGNQKQ